MVIYQLFGDFVAVLFIAEIVWLTIGMIWLVSDYSTCPAKAPKRAVLGE